MQRMSLGSRELFHSDFLSWLFEEHPDALMHVFDLSVQDCNVSREEQHLDLVVRDDKTPVLIVENKVKSYPDLAQLKRYSSKFPSVNKRFLLTLVPPGFEMPQGWEALLYKDLADALQLWWQDTLMTETPSKSVADEHKQYVIDYITLIGHLVTVAEKCFDPEKILENDFWFRGGRTENLSKVGFSQTLQKFEAMAFRDFLKHAVPAASGGIGFPALVSNDDIAPEEDHVKVWSALFNNTPCVTLEPALANPSVEGVRFEIQIQGKQYRRLIAGPPLRDAVGLASRSSKSEHAWACLEASGADSWLFGRERKLAANGEKGFLLDGAVMASKMRGDLCFYKPDVVYQYLDIMPNNDHGSLSPKYLPTQISKDIKLAFELLRRCKITNNH